MKTAISLLIVLCLVGCSKVVGPVGVPGPAGPTGDKGDTGAQGPAGQDGTNGHDGADGQDGAQGPAGEDGKPARVVPLCPGQSNYGTFVEIALCINNKLYAVYSLNGGFLTYIAPGDYTSNGVGSACNFTVQQNCVVHNN